MCPAQNSSMEALTINGVVFGGGSPLTGDWIGMRPWSWGRHDGISALIRKGRGSRALFPSTMGRHGEKTPYASQGESPHQARNLESREVGLGVGSQEEIKAPCL